MERCRKIKEKEGDWKRKDKDENEGRQRNGKVRPTRTRTRNFIANVVVSSWMITNALVENRENTDKWN